MSYSCNKVKIKMSTASDFVEKIQTVSEKRKPCFGMKVVRWKSYDKDLRNNFQIGSGISRYLS